MQQTKTTRISALLPAMLVEEVKKYSNSKKITQSKVVQNALESWMKIKLNNDTKDLAKIDFDDLPSETEWLNIQTSL